MTFGGSCSRSTRSSSASEFKLDWIYSASPLECIKYIISSITITLRCSKLADSCTIYLFFLIYKKGQVVFHQKVYFDPDNEEIRKYSNRHSYDDGITSFIKKQNSTSYPKLELHPDGNLKRKQLNMTSDIAYKWFNPFTMFSH